VAIPCPSSMRNVTTSEFPLPPCRNLRIGIDSSPAQRFSFSRSSAVVLHIASWYRPALITRLVHLSLVFFLFFGSVVACLSFYPTIRACVSLLCVLEALVFNNIFTSFSPPPKVDTCTITTRLHGQMCVAICPFSSCSRTVVRGLDALSRVCILNRTLCRGAQV